MNSIREERVVCVSGQYRIVIASATRKYQRTECGEEKRRKEKQQTTNIRDKGTSAKESEGDSRRSNGHGYFITTW